MRSIYDRILGSIEFDESEFEYDEITNKIKYIGKSNKPSQPKGLKNYSYMFSHSNIENIDLSDWDMSKAECLACMFFNCKKLKEIKGLENWNVSNVKNMSHMFYNCESMISIYNLSDWDVSRVIDICSMFYGCDCISDISYLKNWNLSSIKYMDNMFAECHSIIDITCLEDWVIPEGTEDIFYNSSFLSDLNKYFNNKNKPLNNIHLPSYYTEHEVINGIY